MYGIECRIFLPQLREQIQINIYVGLEILILYEAQCATYNFNGLIQSGNFNLMSRLELQDQQPPLQFSPSLCEDKRLCWMQFVS